MAINFIRLISSAKVNGKRLLWIKLDRSTSISVQALVSDNPLHSFICFVPLRALGTEAKLDVTRQESAVLRLEIEWIRGSNGCLKEDTTVALATFLTGKVVCMLTGRRRVAIIASMAILCVFFISSELYCWLYGI